MITVYGADWCNDTRRTLRHLRRLGVSHRYVDVDDDLDALDYVKAVTSGTRRTPVVLLRSDVPPMVEPNVDDLSSAVVEFEMLTLEDVHDRVSVRRLLPLLGVIALVATTVAVAARLRTRQSTMANSQ